MEESDLSIIIPTLNEEENIARLIDHIHDLIPTSKIIVVDDGSTDNTQELVSKRPYATFIDRINENIKGLSASIKDGINYASTKYFMVIDGDYQHPPDSLLEAITCFKKNPELVIGYRIKVENWPLLRKIMSWGAQILAWFSLLLRRRQRPKDIMSGFFGGNTKKIKDIINKNKISLGGYKILFDILKATPLDYTICQFGYVFKNRKYGDSKIGKKHMFEFIKSLF